MKTLGNRIDIYCGQRLNVSENRDPKTRCMELFSQAVSLLPVTAGTEVRFLEWPATQSSSLREQGLIALACAVDLMRGVNPSAKLYALGKKMASFIIHCFRHLNILVIFPCTRSSSSTVRPLDTVDIRLYCLCKQPDTGYHKMIHCESCKDWFHSECIELPMSHPAWQVLDHPWTCEQCDKKSGFVQKKKLSTSRVVPHTDEQMMTPPFPLFQQGGKLTKSRICLQNTCSIDTCLMPFHAVNIELNGSLERHFKAHANLSVRALGEVLLLARLGRLTEAKYYWLCYIKIVPVNGVLDSWGDLHANFFSHFEETLVTKVRSTCTASQCPDFEHESLDRGISFNRHISDMFDGSLDAALKKWLEPYADVCANFFTDTTETKPVCNLTRSCDGLRAYMHRELVGECPPFLSLPVGDLHAFSDNFPERVILFRKAFTFIGTVHYWPGHFVGSFVFQGSRWYYNSLANKLFASAWKERATVALYLDADLLST